LRSIPYLVLSKFLLTLCTYGELGQEDLLPNMSHETQSEPLAIIGFAFKFPQDTTSPEEFWKILEEKRCVVSAIPTARMNIDGFHVKDKRQVDQVSNSHQVYAFKQF
jgi:hypothetical protein